MVGYVFDELTFVGEISFNGKNYVFTYDDEFLNAIDIKLCFLDRVRAVSYRFEREI